MERRSLATLKKRWSETLAGLIVCQVEENIIIIIIIIKKKKKKTKKN